MPKKPVDLYTVRKIALALPDVVETTAWGAPSFKVRGSLMACVPTHKSAEPGSLGIRIDFEQRAGLVAEAPETYYFTDHYLGYPMVLVRLSKVSADALRDLLGAGWRYATSHGAASSPRRRTPARKPLA
jgi:hypothetical protein